MMITGNLKLYERSSFYVLRGTLPYNKNKRAALFKMLLLVRPGGFEPLAFRVGEL